MTTLLAVEVSPRGDYSTSRKLTSDALPPRARRSQRGAARLPALPQRKDPSSLSQCARARSLRHGRERAVGTRT
jgi:hypothetical protein